MTAKALNVYAAKARFSELIDRARGGEEIIVSKNGKPVARIMPLEKKSAPRRVPGRWRGKGWIAPDFDAPLPDDVLELFGIEP